MQDIKFKPYLKENIYRQIRERVKQTIPFQGGEIGTVIGSTIYHPDNTLTIPELKQRMKSERERPQREQKAREAEQRELMKQEDTLSKKIREQENKEQKKIAKAKEANERKLMKQEDTQKLKKLVTGK